MRPLVIAFLLMTSAVPCIALTQTCRHEEGVLLKLHFDSNMWTSTGELSGNIVSSWLQEEISIPLEFRRAGGSSMPAWWQAVSVFDGNKVVRTTYWFKDGTLKAFLSLEDSGAVVYRLELRC